MTDTGTESPAVSGGIRALLRKAKSELKLAHERNKMLREENARLMKMVETLTQSIRSSQPISTPTPPFPFTEPENPVDPIVEAAIASRWSDNVVASQITRQVARSMLTMGKTADEVVERIMDSGVVID